jgi:hypothetical protein
MEYHSRSVTPDPRGSRAFGPRVHGARFPPRFRAPTTVPKYDGETNPKEDGVIMMIIRGSAACPSKHEEKLIRQEIYNTEPAVPSYLKWSEAQINFDRSDHPDHIPQPGRYPLTPGWHEAPPQGVDGRGQRPQHLVRRGSRSHVDSTISAAALSGAISWSHPRKDVMPLRQIDLPFSFGTPCNFCN